MCASDPLQVAASPAYKYLLSMDVKPCHIEVCVSSWLQLACKCRDYVHLDWPSLHHCVMFVCILTGCA